MHRFAPILALLFATLAFADGPTIKVVATTQPLGKTNAASKQFALPMSADLRHFGLFTKDGAHVTATHDGKPDGIYDWVIPASPQLSKDGSTLIYVAQRGVEMFVVVNGLPQKSYYEILPPIVVSDDGKHVAYGAHGKGGQPFIVFDGAEGKPFDSIEQLRMNSTGTRIIYGGVRDKKPFIVDNATEQPAGTALAPKCPPAFSPDGKHAAFTYLDGENHFVTVDGQKYGPYFVLEAESPRFSPDSAHWSLCGGPLHDLAVVLDGKMIDHGEVVLNVIWSPDSKHHAHLARRGEQDVIVRDGVDTEPHPINHIGASSIAFSPDGLHFIYAGTDPRTDDKQFIVLDGKPLTPVQHLSQPIFSPDSRRLAYVSQDAERATLLTQDGPLSGAVHRLINRATITFSPDSKHVAYMALDEDKTLSVYIDGVKGPTFAIPIGGAGLQFDNNATLRCVGMDRELNVNAYTVTITP